MNRRLVILALLYIQRRTNPYQPELSLFEVEARMGFPRDYLEFTAWYLRNKGYIDRADNSDFTLTAEGADFVELNRANIPVLNKLLTGGTGPNNGALLATYVAQNRKGAALIQAAGPVAGLWHDGRVHLRRIIVI
jgi:hypothetical protein